MIKSELVQRMAERNPHLYQRDVEHIVNAILEEEGDDAVPFPVALDPGLRSTRRFNLLGDLSRPSTFVLDGGGTIRYAFVGETPDERPAVTRIIEELEALRASK